MNRYELHLGNCLEVLKDLPDNSVDSIVTDPPYGLSFMNKKWDYDVPSVEVWSECLRVLKPGGHLLSFAGTRTQHRMACNIEDAGFEIRDMVSFLYDTNETAQALIESLTPEQLKMLDATFGRDSMLAWVYGSGFPKSHNLKDDWTGWGTALKPALEPITVARKPFRGTVAANVLKHGTGALNIDVCRISTADKLGGGAEKAKNAGLIHEGWQRPWMSDPQAAEAYAKRIRENVEKSEALGRWPANLIHDGSDEVLDLFPETKSGVMKAGTRRAAQDEPGSVCYGTYGGNAASTDTYGDSGSAARFFYCAKATRKDRNEGMQDPGPQFEHGATLRKVENTETKGNNHPTVKPTDLMAYLCRLVTPPGGVVLDPFMGSGSTGKAAMREGFRFIGIEMDADYLAIAEARIAHEAGKGAA
nr:MAG TPA: adenine-specific methyltransferase [Caudoviricetes sp.]